MELLDVVRRKPPAPWQDGDNIPWHDPAFSERMLREHLAQHHDAASRRFSIIDEHVRWIHQGLLDARPGRILDLGCGPGFYTRRLAHLGHTCSGIDYSPASIDHARAEARDEQLACAYTCDDIRRATFGEGHDLVMLISGELNVFRPEHAAAILAKSRAALAAGGLLLLEVHTEQSIRDIGGKGLRWYSAESSVFSDAPHVCLQEHRWDESTGTSTVRYFVLHAGTTGVDRYAQTYQAYSRDAYGSLLGEAGFGDVEWHPSLTGVADESQKAFEVIVAKAASV